MLNFTCLFIIMPISVRGHELWCSVRDMRLGKCSIIIIITEIFLRALDGFVMPVEWSLGIVVLIFNEKSDIWNCSHIEL